MKIPLHIHTRGITFTSNHSTASRSFENNPRHSGRVGLKTGTERSAARLPSTYKEIRQAHPHYKGEGPFHLALLFFSLLRGLPETSPLSRRLSIFLSFLASSFPVYLFSFLYRYRKSSGIEILRIFTSGFIAIIILCRV